MFIAKVNKHWQWRISTAKAQGGVLWKKSHTVCIVRSPQYYSFSVFKPQSNTQCRLILSVAATCARENAMPSSIGETLVFSMITEDHIQPGKYCIWAALFYPTPYSISTRPLHQGILIFFVHYKMLWITKMFSRRFGENLCRKFVELETRWIFFKRN